MFLAVAICAITFIHLGLPRRACSQKVSPAGARRGVRGEVNLPPGDRRFGRKKRKKKGRKEEGKKEGRKVVRKAGRVYTLARMGRRILFNFDLNISFIF